jgi:hypothetical protein
MGFVYATATLEPTKQELAESWLPSQPWAGGATAVTKVAEYRFDDPEGEVGIETIVWGTPDGTLLQVPFTYRAAPLDGADAHLVGTAEHSALGRRYVYDGCADPVWAAAVASTILTGGTQAQMQVEHDGQLVDVPARLPVQGSGTAGARVPASTSIESVSGDGPVTTVVAGPVRIALARVVGTPLPGDATLTGSVGNEDRVVLAAVR